MQAYGTRMIEAETQNTHMAQVYDFSYRTGDSPFRLYDCLKPALGISKKEMDFEADKLVWSDYYHLEDQNKMKDDQIAKLKEELSILDIFIKCEVDRHLLLKMIEDKDKDKATIDSLKIQVYQQKDDYANLDRQHTQLQQKTKLQIREMK